MAVREYIVGEVRLSERQIARFAGELALKTDLPVRLTPDSVYVELPDTRTTCLAVTKLSLQRFQSGWTTHGRRIVTVQYVALEGPLVDMCKRAASNNRWLYGVSGPPEAHISGMFARAWSLERARALLAHSVAPTLTNDWMVEGIRDLMAEL